MKARIAAAAAAFARARALLGTGPMAGEDVPIVIGGDPEVPACAWAEVRGLDPQGDGFLAVRQGPGVGYEMTDQLYNGDQVFVCDDRGGWFAIVYPGDGPDCGVGTPWPEAAFYSGPCSYGWVSAKWVTIVAG